MKLWILVALALALSGCAGSFEESRGSVRVGALELTARCVSLDSMHRNYGALAKGTAVLAGAMALGELPGGESRGLRIGLAGGALTAGAVAAFSVFESESAAASYVSECSK